MFVKENIYKSRWNGIPVMFHWTVLLTLPWLWFHYRDLSSALLATPAYAFLIFCHELGHAFMARRCGVEVESIRVYILHGLCFYETPYYEKDHILIAWGGVVAQFVILVMALIFTLSFNFFPLPLQSFLNPIIEPILHVLIYINFFTIIFNLLPIQSLDGVIAWRIIPYASDWIKKKFNRPSKADIVRHRSKMKKATQKSSEQITADILKKIQEK